MKIQESKNYKIVKTIISNSNLTAQINHMGAELFSLKNNSNTEFIWEGNPDFWGKHSPVLFPIVGTLKNNNYNYNNTNYHLSRHGFARDTEFQLISKTQISATFSIQSNEETQKVYPFHFELQIIYTLEETSLTIAYKVINTDKIEIPFSIGAHPAVALPGNFEDYSVQFEKEEPLVYHLLDKDLIADTTEILEIEDKKLDLDYKLFENDALIFKSLQSNSLTISKKGNPLLKFNYEDFPHLGIWTKMNAPFLCIEPWFGYSDSVESTGDLFKKEGIQILKPNSVFDAKFSIEVL